MERADPPDPAGARTPAEFVARLNGLRLWSGQPSLRALRPLAGSRRTPAGDDVPALPPSTVSWVLSGKGLPKLPRLDFVEAYVTACLRFGAQPEATVAECLERWRRAWRSLAGGANAAPGDPGPAGPPTPAGSAAPAGASTPAGTGLRRPALLPADKRVVGRHEQLATLDRLLPDRSAPDEPVRAMVVAAVTGMAGIGKTTLAVHWAHRVADRFPDGQLFVDLRGFAPAGVPLAPADAIRGLLDALCPPSERVPPDPAAQAALYRSLLADRRVLLVLDNARDAEHVRPLLPGGARCLVLVTSRDRLTGLVAEHGAHPIALDLFTADEAEQLLRDRLGAERVRAEPAGRTALARRCGGLPLATAIAAARAAVEPTRSLTGLAAELADLSGRLNALDTGDPITDLRTVFSWSYRELTADARHLFRLLGLHPGADVPVAAAASLAGAPVPRVRRPLAELAAVNLVTEHAPDRFALHDLVRAYAIELAGTHDSDDVRRAALHRVLDHYLHTARLADHLLNPGRDPISLPSAGAGVTVTEPAAPDEAIAWFTAECTTLLAAVDQASRHDFDAHTHQLAWFLATYLDRRCRWADEARAQHRALDAARRLGDRPAEVRAHRTLAHAYGRLARTDDAYAHARHALDISAELGDEPGQASAHMRIAYLRHDDGRYAETIDAARQALDLFRRTGTRSGEADARNLIGWCHAVLGHHRKALDHCRAAVALHHGIGNDRGEVAALDSLGYCHHHLGEHAAAVDCYRRALRLYARMGGRHPDAVDVLVHLGDSHRALGGTDDARAAWRRALDLIAELDLPDHPDARRIRTELRALSGGYGG